MLLKRKHYCKWIFVAWSPDMRRERLMPLAAVPDQDWVPLVSSAASDSGLSDSAESGLFFFFSFASFFCCFANSRWRFSKE